MAGRAPDRPGRRRRDLRFWAVSRPNQEMSDYWAGGAAMWVANVRLMDHVFRPVTEAIAAALGPGPGDIVLDVGCGAGTLSELAVDAGAMAVGVDIAEPMVAAARSRVPSATFVVADAQVADLAAPISPERFTGVTSRFGVMFFDEPTAAFANLRAAAAPGARMAFACWRTLDENPMFRLGTSVLLDRMNPPMPPPEPGAPGPTALADRRRLARVLDKAGWSGVDIAPLDFTCDYGLDGSDGVEERMTTVLGTSSGRSARAQLEAHLGPDEWAALLDEARQEIRRHLIDGVVRFPGAAWLVSARNRA
jgi:SAM-dependent methyltransferase